MFEKINQLRDEHREWEEAGKPIRTKERMLEIYSICEKCSNFEKKMAYNVCGVCGCRLHKSDTIIPNKIAWATTSCPLDDPKWIDDKEEVVRTDKNNADQVDEKPNDCGCGKKRF